MSDAAERAARMAERKLKPTVEIADARPHKLRKVEAGAVQRIVSRAFRCGLQLGEFGCGGRRDVALNIVGRGLRFLFERWGRRKRQRY